MTGYFWKDHEVVKVHTVIENVAHYTAIGSENVFLCPFSELGPRIETTEVYKNGEFRVVYDHITDTVTLFESGEEIAKFNDYGTACRIIDYILE